MPVPVGVVPLRGVVVEGVVFVRDAVTVASCQRVASLGNQSPSVPYGLSSWPSPSVSFHWLPSLGKASTLLPYPSPSGSAHSSGSFGKTSPLVPLMSSPKPSPSESSR